MIQVGKSDVGEYSITQMETATFQIVQNYVFFLSSHINSMWMQ